MSFFSLPISDSPRWPSRGCVRGGERVAGDSVQGAVGGVNNTRPSSIVQWQRSVKQARPLTSSCLLRR